MKTAIFPGISPAASLARVVFKSAVTLAALTLVAGNLLATTVAWVSGGPSGLYPSGAGYEDGQINGGAAYNTPCGIASDESGNYLLVADKNNNTVRLLDFSIDDTATLLTYTNYVIDTNIFSQPVGVAIDDNYNIFVLNRAQGNNGTIMEFDDTSELIATNLAHITNAGGIALDPSDDIFVTASNQVIEVSALGVVSTIATITASNCNLQGIVYRHNGMLAVCDAGRDGVYGINPGTGLVSTNAGFHGQGDFVTVTDTSISNTATFFQPEGITESGDGTLILCDYGNNRVKAIIASGMVTNVYGVQSNFWAGEEWPGFEDGTVALPDKDEGVSARLPNGVTVAPDGSLYVTEDYYHIIRHVTGAGFIPQPPAAPVPPTGLTAVLTTNAGNVSVILTWNFSTSENVTNYLVERGISSGGPYSIIANVSGSTDTYNDTAVSSGNTYYYVVQAENAGGESADSGQVSITIPVPPPPAPTIGYFEYVGNIETGFFTQFFPFTNGVNEFNNDISMAILPNAAGISTLYIDGPTPLSGSPTNGSTPLEVYQNGLAFYPPLPVTTVSNMTIEAVNINAENEDSQITSDQVIFQCGNPAITGDNAAEFTLSDITTNVTYYYTTDGTDPLTNAPPSQQVASTNGMPVTLSLNISTNFEFQVRAVRAGYYPSGIFPQIFSAGAFVPNTISWGFAQGECSSAFVGAAGQTYYAPVTLTMLPNTPIYSMQFNMTVSSSGVAITNPAPAAGPFHFDSMLMQPGPAPTNGSSQPTLVPIPPYMYANYETSPVPPSQLVTNSNGQVFVNLEVSNGNELAVGWLERYYFTNLYNTLSQTLIAMSQAHDDLFPTPSEPTGVIVGAYRFKLSPSSVNGQQYQIQINQASATDNGVGNPGSAVTLFTPYGTNSGSLGPGTLNAIKNVTVGSIPYLVGNVYPFGWFNAGDFGNSNLQNADVEQVFEAAIYGINTPLFDASSLNGLGGYTNVSDMYDAMDSCGALGVLDSNPSSAFNGYYTNAGPLTLAQQDALLSGNFTNINEIMFGDGVLDVGDVYVTYLRSEFPDNLAWFQRVWTNGVRVALVSPQSVVPASVTPKTLAAGAQTILTPSPNVMPVSITNTPFVNFTAGDFLATAGQTLTIPINANVFGPYPLRMMMLNLSVVPLDGSPAVTVPIQFSPNSTLGTTLGSATPLIVASSGADNYSAVWLPNTSNPGTQVPGFTNTANLGTLTVTIPTNATSMSAYAVHFDHASASSSGLISFPRRTFTGLITLSPRTNSYYGDGIPDSWRLRYFGTIYNELSVSNANADGTGLNNWQKYLAGLDPTDPTSVLDVGTDQAMQQSRQDDVIDWPSVQNQTYIIERSTTIFPPQWTAISTNIGNGGFMEIHDPCGAGLRIYQVITP